MPSVVTIVTKRFDDLMAQQSAGKPILPLDPEFRQLLLNYAAAAIAVCRKRWRAKDMFEQMRFAGNLTDEFWKFAPKSRWHVDLDVFCFDLGRDPIVVRAKITQYFHDCFERASA